MEGWHPYLNFGLLLLGMHLVEPGAPGRRLDLQRELQLSTLLGSMPDAVFLFDSAGKIIEANRIAEQLCNRGGEQLRGLSIAGLNELLLARDESDRPVSNPSMGVNRALRGEVVRNLRRIFHHPGDGHIIETSTSASPIRESSGKISGAILIVRDITEVMQLQRRLADTQRHKEIGQMAAGLAHDFSNVLDSIVQATALLDSTPEPAMRHLYADLIRKAVDRGAEIIDRVREYLLTGTGRRSRVDVRLLLQETVEVTEPLWHDKPYKVSLDLQPVAPVDANPADLRRVFTNLIINALEAMPSGGELTIRCENVGDSVRATVCDTGGGVPPELQKNLFVPYFTTKPHGTGLGLSGAHRIVNSFGGEINFRTELGKGTTFVVQLPVSEAVQAPKAA